MAIAISGITPATGPTTGGTIHYITGADLNTVTGVTIGGAAAPLFAAQSATLLKVTAPAGTVGAKDVVLSPGAVTLAAAYTYALPTGDEQLVPTKASKYIFEVRRPGDTPWTRVRAVADFKPPVEPNLEDDSDYDGEGWASESKTQLKWGIEAKLIRKIGINTGNYDPGQEILRAAAVKFGQLGLVEVRWYDRTGGPEAFQGFANVSWDPEGGDTKALDIVTAKLSGSGKRVDIVNPAA
ncbi:phage tail tube protein [Actinomadura terrae]|uniref:phage tail tube protein n=1 Tax=Actinomadura terrae TaxID=604353 RepID=UPI001FA6CB3E|nr:IPT/TIG domain-containing protein [Actinomadura terrae]